MLNGARAPIRAVAPCRADLAGGTLDIWPVGLLHPGALTVNMAIPVEVELEVDLAGEPGVAELTTVAGDVLLLGSEDAQDDLTAGVVFEIAPAGGVRIRVISQAPLRSGIGGSSTYGIALGRALAKAIDVALPDERLVALIRDLEARVVRAPTGSQDHWAAVRGGVMALHIGAGGNQIEVLNVDPTWLGERVTVFFSGIRHHSGMVNWQVIRRRLDGDKGTCEAFAEIAEAARICRTGLIEADDDAVASAILCEWKARRRLGSDVSTPELDALVHVAHDAGGTAVKASGAGGGGSIVVWHPPGTRDAIVGALEEASQGGGYLLASGAAPRGCRIVEASPGS